MSMNEAAAAIRRGSRIDSEHDAARRRLRFRYEPLKSECRNCGLVPVSHVVSSGVMFCPEWALRERWGS